MHGTTLSDDALLSSVDSATGKSHPRAARELRIPLGYTRGPPNRADVRRLSGLKQPYEVKSFPDHSFHTGYNFLLTSWPLGLYAKCDSACVRALPLFYSLSFTQAVLGGAEAAST